MKQLKLSAWFILLIAALTSCEDVDYPTICDQQVIISKITYHTIQSDHFYLLSADMNGDCLTIQFAASGCDGSRWRVKLIDSGVLLYSDPPQRNLRFILENIEMCDALIVKEISFDVKKLRVSGNEVLLNLSNSDIQITYKY